MKAALAPVFAWAALGAAYLALAHALDAAHVGFVLLARGASAPLWAIGGAALLVVVRVVVVVLGPGVLAYAACRCVLSGRRGRAGRPS